MKRGWRKAEQDYAISVGEPASLEDGCVASVGIKLPSTSVTTLPFNNQYIVALNNLLSNKLQTHSVPRQQYFIVNELIFNFIVLLEHR